MGNSVAKSMNENMQKNQEFMIESQRIQLERQIHMQNEIREKMVAMQIAKARELFFWIASFYAASAFGGVMLFKKIKKPQALVPLVPLSFILAYQADLAYGSKVNRIKLEAENILSYERDLVCLPMGTPTLATIDESRERQQENQRLNKRVWNMRQL